MNCLRRVSICAILVLATALSGLPAAHASSFLILDSSYGGLREFSGTNGSYLGDLVSPSSGGLGTPGGMAMDASGRIYVSSYSTGKILRYSSTGTFLGVFADGPYSPLGLGFNSAGDLFFNDVNLNAASIQRLDSSGAELGALTAPGALAFPVRLAVGPDGDLFVRDTNVVNPGVRRFDGSTGAFKGAIAANQQSITGIAFGPDGNLYVSNAVTDQVLRYDGTTGAFIDVFVTPTPGLTNPAGLAFSPDGYLYVLDSGQGSVRRFDGHTGSYVDLFVAPGTAGLASPQLIMFVPEPATSVLLGIGFIAVIVGVKRTWRVK